MSKRNKTIWLSTSVGLACIPAALLAKQGKGGEGAINQHPNILFILCDDMGYGDLACYGQPYIHTPHIDQMAREGCASHKPTPVRLCRLHPGQPL